MRQFVDSGKLALADPAEVRRRNTTKDVALLAGLAVLAVATGVTLQRLGLVDFVSDAAQSGGEAAGSAVEGAAKAPLQLAAPKLEAPNFALTQEGRTALGIAGAGLGSVLLVKATRDGVVKTVRAVGGSAQRAFARTAVLAAAGAIGYLLLSSQ